VFGADGTVGPGVDAAIEAYSRQLAGPAVLELTPGRQTWPAGPEDVEVVPTGTTVRLTSSAGTFDVDEWTAVRLRDGAGFWARVIPGDRLLVRTGIWSGRVAGADSHLVQRLAGTEVFAGAGVGRLYRSGRFGPRLVDGGDGSAEEVFVSSLRCVARSFDSAVDAVLAGHDADLVVIYLPLTDDVGHEFAGWCDPHSAAYRPDAADPIWDHVRRCYAWSDAVLGRVLDRARDAATGDTVILAADHGMVGSAYLVHVNEALVRAGLAVPGADGLDPRGCSVVYHPANNGALRVNHTGLPGGSVPRERSGALLRQAMAVLAEIPAVTGFLDGRGRPLTVSDVGERDEVAYVVLHDDYQPTAVLDGGPVVRPMVKSAGHVVNTGTDRLYATFAAAGPGITAGADLGTVDNTFAAGLVLRQLAIDAPLIGTEAGTG